MANARTKTADIVHKALNGGGHTAGVVTEKIIANLKNGNLIYPHREGKVRAVIHGTIKTGADEPLARDDSLTSRLYDALIGSGEIVTSWLY